MVRFSVEIESTAFFNFYFGGNLDISLLKVFNRTAGERYFQWNTWIVNMWPDRSTESVCKWAPDGFEFFEFFEFYFLK